ncbi:hypothetical protein J6590_077562 [Homalodisca vitripennis]|nr:hypothetical protein J6590_077562 [Homalodisca vitripennis]
MSACRDEKVGTYSSSRKEPRRERLFHSPRLTLKKQRRQRQALRLRRSAPKECKMAAHYQPATRAVVAALDQAVIVGVARAVGSKSAHFGPSEGLKWPSETNTCRLPRPRNWAPSRQENRNKRLA